MKKFWLVLILLYTATSFALVHPFKYDLHYNHIKGEQPHLIVFMHGYGGDYKLAERIKAQANLKSHVVSFNFPDHQIIHTSKNPHLTTFGSIQEILPVIFVLKNCIIDQKYEQIDLYGLSAGGGALINLLVVLNTKKHDIELQKLGITPEEKQKICNVIQKGTILLDAPLKSMDEVIACKGPSLDFEIVAKQYRQNQFVPIDALTLLEGLSYNIVVYFEVPDEMLSNRDDDLYIERLKKFNSNGSTTVIRGTSGGHGLYHPALWDQYLKTKNSGSYHMDYTVERQGSKKIIGIAVKTSNNPEHAAKDIPQLSEKFKQEHVKEKIPNKVSDTVYVVYTDYEGDHTKPYQCIIGCEVSSLVAVPPGMVGKTIPGAEYAVFTQKGPHIPTLMNAWQQIWRSALNRAYTADFEEYRPDFYKQPNGEYKIYISLKK